MILNDIDPARWQQIVRELDALCDEIASHQFTDPEDEDDEYPDDCLQRRVYERVCAASLDATFCASGLARTDPLALRKALQRPLALPES